MKEDSVGHKWKNGSEEQHKDIEKKEDGEGCSASSLYSSLSTEILIFTLSLKANFLQHVAQNMVVREILCLDAPKAVPPHTVHNARGMTTLPEGLQTCNCFLCDLQCSYSLLLSHMYQ